jgi:ligand-binding SRPBCC domain-containing protein
MQGIAVTISEVSKDFMSQPLFPNTLLIYDEEHQQDRIKEEHMATIRVKTHIQAPIELCFDHSRNVDMHDEPPIAGVTSGLLELNDTITTETVRFGTKQSITSQISEMERPYRFVDVLTRGYFKTLRHTHLFTTESQGTLMTDELVFRSPGKFAPLIDQLLLKQYMRRILLKRNQHIKQVAEADQTNKYVHAKP